MPLFRYSAKDKKGATRTGTVEALNKEKAARVLEDHELIPISIVPEAKGFALSKLTKGFQKVSGSELVVFTQQLATMVGAGLPLAQSLQTLEVQSDNPKMRQVLAESRQDVEGGTPLSEAFAKHPELFTHVYTNLIKVGETSGQLDKVLLRLSQNLEKQQEFKSKVKGAMVYPILILVAMVGVFVLLMVYVVPNLAEVYKSFDAELPPTTKLIIAISDLLTKRLWLFIVMIVAFVFVFMRFKNTTRGEYFFARLVFKMPIMGRLQKNIDVTEFTRTFGLLISSGVPIMQALEIVSDSMSNVLYQDSLRNAAKQVEKGVALGVPLANDPNFPPMLTQMVSVGEETGKLDEILFRLADFMEMQTDSSIKGLTTALEPIILVLLGGMVAFLVLSIVMPIYNLTSSF